MNYIIIYDFLYLIILSPNYVNKYTVSQKCHYFNRE